MGLRLGEQRHRLVVGAGDADDAVAEALDHLLDVHGDQRLVLDDEDVGRHLARDLAAGLAQQVGELARSDIEDLGGLLVGEAFDGDQQEGLARPRRQRARGWPRPAAPRPRSAGSCGTRMAIEVNSLAKSL